MKRFRSDVSGMVRSRKKYPKDLKEQPKSAWQCSVVPIPRGTFGSIQMIQDSCQNLKISFQVRVASGPHNLKAGHGATW